MRRSLALILLVAVGGCALEDGFENRSVGPANYTAPAAQGCGAPPAAACGPRSAYTPPIVQTQEPPR